MEASKLVEESSGSAPSLTDVFGALADPARLVLLRELQWGTRCVCELAPRLAMAPNLLSYHLRILREAGIVEGSRQGRRVEYRVRPVALQEAAVELVRLAVGGDRLED
jgi:ArsR family transcriptional regulator